MCVLYSSGLAILRSRHTYTRDRALQNIHSNNDLIKARPKVCVLILMPELD